MTDDCKSYHDEGSIFISVLASRNSRQTIHDELHLHHGEVRKNSRTSSALTLKAPYRFSFAGEVGMFARTNRRSCSDCRHLHFQGRGIHSSTTFPSCTTLQLQSAAFCRQFSIANVLAFDNTPSSTPPLYPSRAPIARQTILSVSCNPINSRLAHTKSIKLPKKHSTDRALFLATIAQHGHCPRGGRHVRIRRILCQTPASLLNIGGLTVHQTCCNKHLLEYARGRHTSS